MVEFATLNCNDFNTPLSQETYTATVVDSANGILVAAGEEAAISCGTFQCGLADTRRRQASGVRVVLSGTPTVDTAILLRAMNILDEYVSSGTFLAQASLDSGSVTVTATRWDTRPSQILAESTLAPTIAIAEGSSSDSSADSYAIIIGSSIAGCCLIAIILVLIIMENNRVKKYKKEVAAHYFVNQSGRGVPHVSSPTDFDVVSGFLLNGAQESSDPARAHYYPANEYVERTPYLDVWEHPQYLDIQESPYNPVHFYPKPDLMNAAEVPQQLLVPGQAPRLPPREISTVNRTSFVSPPSPAFPESIDNFNTVETTVPTWTYSGDNEFPTLRDWNNRI